MSDQSRSTTQKIGQKADGLKGGKASNANAPAASANSGGDKSNISPGKMKAGR